MRKKVSKQYELESTRELLGQWNFINSIVPNHIKKSEIEKLESAIAQLELELDNTITIIVK